MATDKIKGGLLGLALGDALGAPFEFRYSIPTSMYNGKLEYPISLQLRYQPKKYSVVGQVTDDTTMAGALLRSIIRNRTWVRDDVIKEYLQWANSEAWSQPDQVMVPMKFLGINTRALFKGIKTVLGFNNRYASKASDTQSNGSLMRAYPLILLFFFLPPEQAYLLALEDTNLTNPNNVNRDVTLIYLTALRYILEGKTSTESLPILQNLAQPQEVKDVIKQVITGVHRNVRKNKGWILHALWIAFTAWRYLDSGASFHDIMMFIIN